MTKEEFLIFLSKLLEDYLSALKAWVEDMDG